MPNRAFAKRFMTTLEINVKHPAGFVSAVLPDVLEQANDTLRDTGIDPDWLSIAYLGKPEELARTIV
jgi:hypothetical protein